MSRSQRVSSSTIPLAGVGPENLRELPRKHPAESSSLPLHSSISAGPIGGRAYLSDNEVRRRLWHMVPGLLPFLFAGIPRLQTTIAWQIQWIMVCGALGLSALALHVYDTIAREGEGKRDQELNALTYGAMALLLLVCFPSQPQLAAVVVEVLAWGDGSATLFGMLWGRKKLPWNAEKTWVGSAAFFLCSAPAAALAYWLLAMPAVSLPIAALCGGAAALLAAIVESVSSGRSDNLRVSGTAAVAVVVCHSMLFGWPG